MKDTTVYEKISIMLCKHCLHMPKRASNMVSKAELGRFPLMKNIMIAVLKFNERSNLLNNSDPLRKAVISQAHLNKNFSNGLTYVQFSNRLKEQLNIHFVMKRNNRATCTKQLFFFSNFSENSLHQGLHSNIQLIITRKT